MTYTCSDYRSEMILLGLRRRLLDETLSDETRRDIEKQIKALERAMGME